MRKGVVVCGANGERGYVLESLIEGFIRKNRDRVIQFSVNTVAISPMVVGMSGIQAQDIITINGCGNRCAHRLLEMNGINPGKSWLLDENFRVQMGPCRRTCCFDFEVPSERQISECVDSLTQLIG